MSGLAAARDDHVEARRVPALRIGAGLILLALYVVPLFMPPASFPPLPPAPDASLIARVFQRVPVWWMTARLVALLGGAAMLASVASRSALPRVADRLAVRAAANPAAWQYVALVAAVLHVACIPLVPWLSAAGQTLYVVWLAVPALLLAIGTRAQRRPRRAAPQAPDGDRGAVAWAPIVAVIALWAVTRLVISWHSPRVANVVDMWRTFAALGRLAAAGENFLTVPIAPEIPGVNATPLFFHGLSLLEMMSATPTLPVPWSR